MTETINQLEQARLEAWEAFRPQSPPGRDNDFVGLVLANLAWHKDTGAEWDDEIDRVISRYSKWIRYTRKKPDEKPPASIWNEGKHEDCD